MHHHQEPEFPNATQVDAVYGHSLSISREVLILWWTDGIRHQAVWVEKTLICNCKLFTKEVFSFSLSGWLPVTKELSRKLPDFVGGYFLPITHENGENKRLSAPFLLI